MLLTVAPIVASAQAVTVPIDDLAGILVVSATVDGEGPYHFVLDTGAGITVVTPELAEAVGLTAARSDVARGTSDQAIVARLTTLKSLAVGTAMQANVAAAIVPLPLDLTYQGAYGTIDGIVGATFLRDYVVSLDIAGSRATFAPTAAQTPPEKGDALPVTFTANHIPIIGAIVEGTPGRFAIDSGNNDDLLLAQSFTSAHGVGSGYRAPIHAEYVGVGGSASSTRLRVASISVGPFILHGIPAEISQAKSGVLQRDGLDGNLGYDVLRQFVVTVDYGNARLYLQPSAAFDTPVTVAGTGIIPERNADGTFGIVKVLDGTPAAAAGVKAGDTIVAIDGKRAASMSDADYRAAVGSRAGTSVIYTLRSGNASRLVTMTTVDLLPQITH
ncbi:MAG: aspartyl protease family protein [Candidatus Cybelea sp.]